MVLGWLLLGGAYAVAKGGKALTNKKEWDLLVADYELERDFEKVLKLCGGGESNVNWTNKTPEINETVINNCITNLKTIPYLTINDLDRFEIKAWETKLEQVLKEKEEKSKRLETELNILIPKIQQEPTHRKTINIFKTNLRTTEYSKILYKMCKYTIWGDLIYNPRFKEWLESNDLEEVDKEKSKRLVNSNRNPNEHWLNMPMPCGHTRDHEVWVIDEPIGYSGEEIYWKCRRYIESTMISEEEQKIRSKCSIIKNNIENRKNHTFY